MEKYKKFYNILNIYIEFTKILLNTQKQKKKKKLKID